MQISVFSCMTHILNSLIQCTPSEGPLLYHKLMTPKWIQDHAAISGLLSATNAVMRFKPPVNHARLLRIPIFQRGQVPEEDIVVYIKLYLHSPKPSTDSDPVFGISDGRILNSIVVSDSGNYPNNACWFHTAGSGPIRINPSISGSGTCGGIPITYTTYPNEVTLTFYPSEQLGTFHITPDGGYTTVGSFTKKLDLTQGLFFEMYGHNQAEEYRLQYIQIEVKSN